MCFLSVRDFVAKISRKNEFAGVEYGYCLIVQVFFLVFLLLVLFVCKKILKYSFL